MNISSIFDYSNSDSPQINSLVVSCYLLLCIFLSWMVARCVARFFHTNPPVFAAEKSLLATLRKKTGYTFANCKKALEMHNNDLNQAEAWLKEQAQALGWSKATKLEGRQTRQGLVAVALEGNNAILVELNCETDFVARNNTFKTMAETAARACLAFAVNQLKKNEQITKIGLDSEQLKSLKASDGKSLADHVALMIGMIGENASLRRAVCLTANEGLHISGYAHPSGNENNNVLCGRLGGLVAIKQIIPKDIDLRTVGKELCQHVVGMAPKRIGGDSDQISKDVDEEECLIHQEFLADNSLLVSDVLAANGIEVVDFKRFECGETVQAVGEPLDMVETCQ